MLRVTSSSLCKTSRVRVFHSKLAIEDGIDNSVHAFHVHKADHRSCSSPHFHKATLIILVVRNCFQRCLGKLKNANSCGRSFSNCLTAWDTQFAIRTSCETGEDY